MRRSSPQTDALPAFKEVAPSPLYDRRNSQRIRQTFPAEISQWIDNRAGQAFAVQVQDLSRRGVGIVHSGRREVGAKYLLEIPRPGQPPLGAIFTVVRCDQVDGGLFHTEMEASEILDVAVRASILAAPSPARTSSALTMYVIVALVAAVALAVVFVI